MTHRYFVLASDREPDHCVLGERPVDMPALHRPERAMPMEQRYTKTLKFRMSRRFGGKKLTDVIRNTFGYLVVSARVRDLLAREVPTAQAEFLPILLVDHKGKKVDAPYFIANLLVTADCADLKKSEYVQDPITNDRVFFQFIDKLVLDPKKTPSDLRIFRVLPMPRLHLVRDDLAAELRAAKVTGVRFQGLDETPDV